MLPLTVKSAPSFITVLFAVFLGSSTLSQSANGDIAWKKGISSTELVKGMGLNFPFGDKAEGAADIKLTGTDIISETGEIALAKVKNHRDLEAVTTVPDYGYSKKVSIEGNLSSVLFFRFPDGRLVKLRFGSFEEGGSMNNPEVKSISIYYMVSANSSTKATGTATPFHSRLAGKWKLRIPTGVLRSTDGRNIYQEIIPGAGFGVITLAANGDYTWEGIYWNKPKTKVSGKAERLQPAFAQQGVRYYKINDGKADYLIFLSPTNKPPFTVAYVQGGFIASGEPL